MAAEGEAPSYSRTHALNWHHYRALGLRIDASADDIKLKYRKLALVLHPDKHPGNEEKVRYRA